MRNTLFLLGGADLEMAAIKELLVKEDIDYIDKNLSWGAKLSSYQKELEKFKDRTIYGVELIEDIAPPPNYYQIDHHNELSSNESSLFQVLKLLGKEPTREQKLISANDIGHIEAMKCMGASEKEIEEIRKRDRAMQGVSQEEEEKAIEEIEKIEKEHGVYYLKTSLEHFSPIVDRFKKRPFLIYGQKSLVYYGDIDFLKDAYKEQIKNHQAYHGRGFFGFDRAYIEQIELESLVEEIKELSQKNIYSYHQFMFPFRFDKIEKAFTDKHTYYRDTNFDKRVLIDEELRKNLEKDDWVYEKFEVKNHLDYNEEVYFHDFVKDALFNREELTNENGATSYFFQKILLAESKYVIKVKNGEKYSLDLTGMTLRLFDTGIAILSFEVENDNYGDIDDILKINYFGRRVYPQFLGTGSSAEKTKEAFLADYIEANGVKEDFSKKYKNIRLASFITKNLGSVFCSSSEKKDESHYFIQPIIDDRMFVLSWYGNDAFSDCVKKDILVKDWYRYVFVDGGDMTVQDEEMHREFIEKASYKRWKNYGTMYGITRYSFVCLSQNTQFIKEEVVLPHMKTMYFQMVTLLLAQRASLLRFSDEIAAISDVRGKDTPSVENISILYKNYLRFVNKLYFKEITAQDQGIELYDMAINVLDIRRDIEDLRQEIGSLNSYAFLKQEKEEKEQMNKLTKLGTYLIPPTLVAGFFGMNVFGKNSLNIENKDWLIGSIIAMILSIVIAKMIFTSKGDKSE